MPQRSRARAKTPSGRSGLIAKLELTQQLPHLLRRSHFAAEATFSRLFADQDITSRQAAILLTVTQQPGISQAKLGEATGLDENTLSNIVSRMVRKKLINRARSKQDKRANGLTITSTGEKALKRIGPTLAGYGKVVASNLTLAEHDMLVSLLRRLLALENTTPGVNGYPNAAANTMRQR